jgi:hypothetical protein
MLASRKGRLELVRLLLDRGANVNAARTDDGMTALMCAAHGSISTSEVNNLPVIQLLIERGAKVNARTKPGFFGSTALDYANREEIASYLKDVVTRVKLNPLEAAGAAGGAGAFVRNNKQEVQSVVNPLAAARAAGATVEVSNPFYHEGKQRKSRKASKGRKSRKSRKGRKGRKTKRN